MKNRVDIGKLIDKKYSDGQMTIREFNELIDSVLNETMDVRTKLDTTELEEVSQSEDVFDHAFGMGGAENERPDEPGYGSNVGNVPQVRPTTVAENTPGSSGGSSNSQGSSAVQKAVQFTIKVPDLYSLMTNTKAMAPNSEDRKFVNNIIKNINAPTNNWIGRVKALQEYTSNPNNLLSAPSSQGDITEAISSMILLNVLKKLSYFTDHPGKQFEYVFAPFIHPDAHVVGSEDTEVDDVNSPTGRISLKFLSSASPNIEVSTERSNEKLEEKMQGFSKYENLIDILEKKKTDNIITPQETKELEKIYKEYLPKLEKAFLDYIVVRTFGNGLIQFGRVGLTKSFSLIKRSYVYVEGHKGKENKLYKIKQGGGVNSLPTYMFLLGSKEVISPDTADQQTDQEKPKLTNQLSGESFDMLGLKIPAEVALSNKIVPELNYKLPQYMQSLKNNLESNDMQKISKIAKSLNKLPGYVKLDLSQKDQSEEILNIARDLVSYYEDKMKFLKSKMMKENVERVSLNEYKIPIAGDVWSTMLIETLNLGEVSKYNEQQLSISDSVQKMYADVLESLDCLNKNITTYFATAGGKNQNAGEKALQCATDIVQSVTKIQSSKT